MPDATSADKIGCQSPYDLPLGGWLVNTLAEGWDPAPAVRHPAVADAAAAAATHRLALSSRFPHTALVIPAGSAPVRNNDTRYAFRPSSAYTYLTGDQAEHGVLLLTPGEQGHQATLYLPERAGPGLPEYFTDRSRGDVWVGGVPSAAATAAQLNLPVRPRRQLPADLANLSTRIFLLRGVDAAVDATLPGAIDGGLARGIDELRAIKDEWEIDQLAAACEATARGFADVVRALPMLLANGGRRGERWLEGTFWRRARYEGNDVGYSSIVAAGAHGTSLHWASVDGDVIAGQLLVADMGVETSSLYTADITRTLPIDGSWTDWQLRVYQAVYEANRAGIAEVCAGQPYLAAHHAAQWVLADYLHHWGVIGYKPHEALHSDPHRPGAGAHRRYTLHSTSHMLGLDVHDCTALTPQQYVHQKLRPGHCLTVEPGLYFQVNDRTVSPELRGLAVRIEDDVVVTSSASHVLSANLPTHPSDLLTWMKDIQATRDDQFGRFRDNNAMT